MQKKLYKLKVIKEYIHDGEYGIVSCEGLFYSSSRKYDKILMKEIYINLYDIASLEEHKSMNNHKPETDGYILKMSNGTYLISAEDAKKIIEILECVN